MRRVASAVSMSLLASTLAIMGVPDRIVLIVRIELLVLVAFFVLGTTLALRVSFPAEVTNPFRRKIPPTRPVLPLDLDRVQTDLRLASVSATSIDRLLVPRLRAIATARLRRRGLDPAVPHHRDACAAACGPVLWELIRPDRVVSYDATAPGIALETVDLVLANLEAL